MSMINVRVHVNNDSKRSVPENMLSLLKLACARFITIASIHGDDILGFLAFADDIMA